MIKIAVVEDNPMHAKQLLNCLNKYQLDHNLVFRINTFDTGTMLLENDCAAWNIFFLDIEMPYIDGMSLAQKNQRTGRFRSYCLCNELNAVCDKRLLCAGV